MPSSDEPLKSLTSQNKNLTPQQLKDLSKRIQQSSYGPEFLKEIAKKLPSGLPKDNGPRFKVVTGKEADSIYHSVVGDEDHDHKGLSSIRPVVLAFPVQEAGRKVVDYYMTWRGKTKTHRLKGDNRNLNFLDNEFKKVRKTLDNEFNNASPTRPSIPLDSKPQSAPDVLQSTADTNPDSPRPPSLASVTSLPLLGMVRGVPLTNRIPLRVLNPDPVSPTATIISRDSGVFPGIEDVFSNPLEVVPEVVPVPADPTSEPPSTLKEDGASSSSTPPAEKKRSRRRAESSSPQSENGNSDSKSPDSSGAESPEILIVLMDEKDGDKKSKKAHWHGLERQILKRGLARKPSHRPSPWDGPIAKSGSGQIQRYHTTSHHRRSHRNSNGSGYETSDGTSGEDDDDSSDEEWKDQPVVPINTARSPPFTTRDFTTRDALAALGYISPTPSLTNGSFTYSPAHSTLSLYGPAPSTYSGYNTPQNTPYATPYTTPYSSPYSSPYALSAPSLPGTYQSPYVAPQQWLPTESPLVAAGVVPPASVVSSPYVPPPRPLSAWGNRSMGSMASSYSSPYVPAQNGLRY